MSAFTERKGVRIRRLQRLFKQIRTQLGEQNGFILMEIMVGVLILSIIMAIVIPNLKGSGDKAQKGACTSDQQMIRNALDNYWLEHHVYPSGVTNDILSELVKDKYIQTLPKEPAGGDFLITIPTNGDDPTVSCTVHGELGT